MPSSHFHQLNEIMELIMHTDPNSLLDNGIRFGKHGFLSREYLELWDGRDDYKNWKRIIDGIEAFSDYITTLHEIIYNNIFRGNAVNILPTIKKKYDLILLIDVLEHFSYEEGKKVLDECQRIRCNTIISTPNDIGIQNSGDIL